MKKILIIFSVITMLFCIYSNIYAVNLINSPVTTDIYSENNNSNFNNGSTMDNNTNSNLTSTEMPDGVSIAITIGSILALAAVVFFYLIPKD